MQTPKSRWDVERAAAWLRKHTWGARGEAAPPPMDETVLAAARAQPHAAVLPESGQHFEEDEIDIAGWPALVAPFYD